VRVRHWYVWTGFLSLFGLAVFLFLVIGPGGPVWRIPAQLVGLRLLRLALGMLAGGVLALVGAALQGLLRNPLVDPFTLGVSSGAAFGVSLAILGGAASSLAGPLAGFAGAGVTIIVVYLLARVRGRVTVTGLVLAGVIISFLFSSLVMLAMVLGKRPLGQAVYLLMGHIGTTFTIGTVRLFGVSAVVLLVGCAVLLGLGRDLDLLSANEETALSLGVDAGRVMKVVFVVSSVLVGIVVAFAGAISFVGLVVPHIARLLLGPAHRRVMPASFLLGATLLLFADLAARNIVPGGLPLSIVTALFGVPFFIYLLRTRL
jgi:iron complex transport system permease protein